MKLLTIILTIFIVSGCCSKPITAHPDLLIPSTPQVPKFTREMLDCGNHNPSLLPLCLRIKEREVILRDHIETLEILVKEHNNALAID